MCLVAVRSSLSIMSLSVPQNGVKPDNEPVIELFVKVRQVSHLSQLSLDIHPQPEQEYFFFLAQRKDYNVNCLTQPLKKTSFFFFFITFSAERLELINGVGMTRFDGGFFLRL